MKTLALLLLTVLAAHTLQAQTQKPDFSTQKQEPGMFKPTQNQKVDIINANNTEGRNPTTIGKSFSSDDLVKMNQRNVNKVAGLTNGVESRTGETPSIRGAGPSGTAYFVDGVRVYGTVPGVR